MRVLHLFSNWKWTGPAEPALNLCVAQRARGIDARFVCGLHPNLDDETRLMAIARERGVEPVVSRTIDKHQNPLRNLRARRVVAEQLRREPFDIVHTHLDNALIVAAPCARRFGVPIVHSVYTGDGTLQNWTARRLVRSAAAVLVPSQTAYDRHRETFGVPETRLFRVDGAIDTHRFDPDRPLPDARKDLPVGPGTFVFGIVARMQRHRRYEDLFWALKQLVDSGADVHLVVFGRGTHQATVGETPVRELGLADRVTFAGIVTGDEYVAKLKALDAGIYLYPGSDGTCRAVRELMAMGVPVIAADRGMLAEIVHHESDGFVFGETREDLLHAMRQLQSDRSLTQRLSAAARNTARQRYSLDGQCDLVLSIYAELMKRKAGEPKDKSSQTVGASR